jgi:hypothetical protein
MIDRYSIPEMAAVWHERVRLALWVKIEVEAVKAWAELGRVPEDAARRIEESASVSLTRMQEIEEETQHDVVAFVKALGEELGEDARYVHLGMTSSTRRRRSRSRARARSSWESWTGSATRSGTSPWSTAARRSSDARTGCTPSRRP